MPLVFFLSPVDPRMLSHAGRDAPAAARRAAWCRTAWCSATTWTRRWTASPGREGTFNLCSFWLVEALTRASAADPGTWRRPG